MSVASLHRDTAFQVRSLFRSLLRQSNQFSNYNFRDYARRKTRDSFRAHKDESEERRIQELIQDGLQSLRLLKRQTVISQFYQLDKLVVEGQKTGKETGDHGGIVRQKDTGGLETAVLLIMPSTFRASRSGRHLDNGANRSRTGQIDHDVFEGLPVRRWSRQPHTVSQAPKGEESEICVQGPGGTTALPELPMPRDSQLLPAMSRALLRAARAGCIYIRPSGRAAEEEKEEATDAEDQNAATVHLADRSFISRKWTTLPKHMEPPEVEFLAKRRPGLSSLYGTSVEAGGAIPGPMRKTKIKRTDPETGNISIYEVWVPEGHHIEGEITGDVQMIAEQSEVPVKAEAPAPGTVVEGVGVVNAEGVVVAEAGSASVMTPPKRRPPPPKRKGADAAAVHGVAPAHGAVDGAKEGEESRQVSNDQSGQEEDDDEGEEGDESDEGDESMVDAKTPETPQAPPSFESAEEPAVETPADQSKDVEMADAILETQAPVSEPVVAGQEPLLQPPTGPAIMQAETPQMDADVSASASASVTPAPPAEPTAEDTKESSEQPVESAPTERITPAFESTEEPLPKEESQAPEPVIEMQQAQELADITPSEVKPEPGPQPAEESVPAPSTVSPEEPIEETPSEPAKQPEPEQPAEEVPATQPEPVVEESAQPSTNEQTPDREPVHAPEPTKGLSTLEPAPVPRETKEDIEMGEAPPAEESATRQSPVKRASPAPAAPVEPEIEPTTTEGNEPPTPEPSEPVLAETAPAAEPQSEELPASASASAPGPEDVLTEAAPAPEPLMASESKSESESEEKKDEQEPAPPESA
ncbi:LYR family protein [Penicillium canariense]|uniref:LYR family protein n=1 Tax=Penicillium canariense TaxID=189055 RepID=A0A9W9HRA9_9EURO|nr:LYR family protein [Penicillium canariense]KAJ5152986.1 LYR family protein [Penicillium canariense]